MKYFFTCCLISIFHLSPISKTVTTNKPVKEALGTFIEPYTALGSRNHSGSYYVYPSFPESFYQSRSRRRSHRRSRLWESDTKSHNETGATDLVGYGATPRKPKAYGSRADDIILTSPRYMTVKVDELNLYSGAGSDYAVIEKLKRNQVVKAVNRSNQWLRVKVINSGNIGYCNAAYLK